MTLTTDIKEIRRDIEVLTKWSEDHTDRHEANDRRLDILLENLSAHTNNHHSRGTQAKQFGGMAAIGGVLVGTWEVISRVFL